VVIQSTSEAGDGEGLAGSPSDEEVDGKGGMGVADGGEVAMVRNLRVMMGQD